MSPDEELGRLQGRLRSDTSNLAAVVFDSLAPSLVREGAPHRDREKIVNDPVWKIFPLNDPILSLVETPLVQRLRRIRQTGLVHLVYPGANHTRFEHTLGAMCAAARMFDTMAETAKIPDEARSKFRKIVLAAAVLHDVGHTVFSHVGEHVLRTAFADGFSAVQRILPEAFPDNLNYTSGVPAIHEADDPEREVKKKLPPAAELMSALFVLSPAFTELIRRLDLGYEASECQLMITALILGKPRNLIQDNGKTYYYFLKNLISGDLDCDKVDYVARDAYYAGIPTATDIERILSQITTVEIRDETEAPEVRYKFGDGNADVLHLYGIKAASASALEMFVMTRAYLFERLYAHPKVRAAERALERLLVQRITFGKAQENWDIREVLSFLYMNGGDDHVLGALSATVSAAGESEDGRQAPYKYFANRAQGILERQLPVRALAISRQTMSFGSARGDTVESADFVPWQFAEDQISAHRFVLEEKVCSLAGLDPSTVYVDWFLPNPIREDPDIWVKDPAENRRVKRISEYFNVEQLANAYRSTKQVGWIFSNADDQDRVAAAAAIYLQMEYDLPPNREAYTRAKVLRNKLEIQLDLLSENKPDLAQAVLNIKARTSTRTIRPVAAHFVQYLGALGIEREVVAERLADQIKMVGLPRTYYEHLEVAKLVMEILLRHASAFWCAAEFRDPPPDGKNEKRFQTHLKNFCDGDPTCVRLFKVVEGAEVPGGETDLIFESRARSKYPDTIVELKSKKEDFKRLYNLHAGQPPQYAERDKAGRVSILYVQFDRREAVSLADTLLIRKSGEDASLRAIICLAQKAFCRDPSSLGDTSSSI